MRRIGFGLLFSCGIAVTAGPALADDAAFVEIDPPTVLASGEWLFQQYLGWTAGHTRQTYNGFQEVSEFDYGITDRLQVGMSLEYDWQWTRDLQQPGESESAPALLAEVVYVLAPSDKGPVGVALALDPYLAKDDRGFELRALIQMELFGFQNVLNVSFENAWERDVGHWNENSGIAVGYGIAFPLTTNWTLSLELANERSFGGLFPSSELRQSSDTYFIGPTLQYECDFAVLTLGAHAQLPWASGDGAEGGFTPDAERFRMVLRFTKSI